MIGNRVANVWTVVAGASLQDLERTIAASHDMATHDEVRIVFELAKQ